MLRACAPRRIHASSVRRIFCRFCSELTAIAKPCILVPSPNVTNNHQEKNARVLEQHGAAVVLLEPEIDGKRLYGTAKELLADRDRLTAMSKSLTELSVTDASEEIYQTLIALLK